MFVHGKILSREDFLQPGGNALRKILFQQQIRLLACAALGIEIRGAAELVVCAVSVSRLQVDHAQVQVCLGKIRRYLQRR